MTARHRSITSSLMAVAWSCPSRSPNRLTGRWCRRAMCCRFRFVGVAVAPVQDRSKVVAAGAEHVAQLGFAEFVTY